MNPWRLRDYLVVLRDFDAQLEAYLLADSQRQERAETTLSLGKIHYQNSRVMIDGKQVERDWLKVTGMAVGALVDREKIILNMFRGTDSSLHDSVILRAQKRDGKTCLTYQEPLVVLRKLRGKCMKRREL